MELAFILAERQNNFFVEIVEAFRDELEQLGVESSLHWGAFPELRDERIYVLVPPHEWWALQGHRTPPAPEQLKRTVFVCAEQPGTSFFTDDVELAPLAGGVLDVNRKSVDEFARQGVKGVRHSPLGWTRTWSHVTESDLKGERASAGRDIDVLHLGIYSERRARVLADGADVLAGSQNKIVLGDHDRPNWSAQANYTMAGEKWDTLKRARVLLNIHVADRPYFEWLRIVQTISNGAAVVSDLSLGIAPLEPVRHFLAGRPEALGLLAAGLLAEEEERARMAHDAFVFLKAELPFAASAVTLADTAESALSAAKGSRAPAELPALTFMAPAADPSQPGPAGESPPATARPKRPPARSRDTGQPRVSLLLSEDEYGPAVLAGISGSKPEGHELVRYGGETGAARNAALKQSQAPLVCLLTGGVSFYPGGLGSLIELLDEHSEADFVFGMVAVPARDGGRDLASFYPWRPDRPGAGNFIDPATLWRKDALLAVRGFSAGSLDDPWRDHELWRRVSEQGLVSVHLPRIVASAFAG